MNILFNKQTRNRNRGLWNFFNLYYERDNLSLKEKYYTFQYNLDRTNLTTKGESTYFINMVDVVGSDIMKQLREEYRKDFIEYTTKI